MATKLTSRPKTDLPDEELALVGDLTSFGYGLLQSLDVLMANVISYNLELLHVEQRFLFDTFKIIADIAVEDNIEWGQTFQAKVAEL